MKKYLAFLTVILVLSGAAAAFAHSYQLGTIRIGHVWTRAMPPGTTAAAIYLPLLNTGKDADRLLGAASPNAVKIQLHSETDDGGVMKMRAMDGLDLPPNVPVALHPGGMHLMAMGIKQPLRAGDRFPLTLQFEKAGSIAVEAVVAPAGAMGGEPHD